MSIRNKNLIMALLTGTLILAMFSFTGCKKKSKPAAPTETKQVISQAIEQKKCPVMDAPINKELYTEYKGKKVYFCCPGCKEKFVKEPDKYISKLPQFSN